MLFAWAVRPHERAKLQPTLDERAKDEGRPLEDRIGVLYAGWLQLPHVAWEAAAVDVRAIIDDMVDSAGVSESILRSGREVRAKAGPPRRSSGSARGARLERRRAAEQDRDGRGIGEGVSGLTSKRQGSQEAGNDGPGGQTATRPSAEAGDRPAPAFPQLMADTSPAAARRYFDGLRGLGPSRRLEVVAGLSRMVRSFAFLGARRRHPNQSVAELRLRVAEAMYGKLQERFGLDRYSGNFMAADTFKPESIALVVGEALDALGIAYFVGGSIASGLHGEPRATNDIDLVLELSESQIAPLVQRLGPDFSVDEEGLKSAIRARRSDNIFFLPFFTKIDIFIRGPTPFDESEMARRLRFEVEPGRHVWIKSPEDSVLRKLLWFKAGGGALDSQWRDVLGVLRMSGPEIDDPYLDEWAKRLGIDDLLARARGEVAST